MDFAQVIHDAWRLTIQTSKLKWMCFFTGFAAVMVFVAQILWQAGLLSEELGFLEHSFVYKTIEDVIRFLIQNNLIGWAVFVLIFVLLFQFVFPSWILSSLILGIYRKYKHPSKYLSSRQIVMDGFQYFPKLIELHAIFSPFSFMTITLFSMTLFRFYHGDIFFKIFLPLILVFSVFALIVNVFTVFCPFFIVLEDVPVMSSIKKSIGLVFINFGVTMSVIVLMILVSFRIILNVIVVIGVPLGLFFALSYFGQYSWFGIAMTILILFSVGILALSAYLTAIVEVFSHGVWIKVFLLLREKQEEEKKSLEEEKTEKEDFFPEEDSYETAG